jgi:hypothetical protein
VAKDAQLNLAGTKPTGAAMRRGTEGAAARIATRSAAACGLGLLVIVALTAAWPGTAAAATMRTVGLHNGVTTVRLSVPHRTGGRPPAILVDTRPSGISCAVYRYSYHAINRRAEFRMRMRCRHVPAGARARITFRAPYVRVFSLRGGSGTIHLRLDKLPGPALPMVQLTTRPRTTRCSARPRGLHIRRHVLTASARITCHGLPPHARGVLSVGGLLAAHGLTVKPSSARASAAAALPCGSPRTLSLLGHSISWIYCYTPWTTLGPWQTTFLGFSVYTNPPCPAGWLRANQVSNDLLRITLVNLYRPAPYATPTDAWAWSYYLGFVTNWQFRGDINVMWQYNCYQVS